MGKIVNIGEYKKNPTEKQIINLTVDDIFNLFLIFERSERKLPLIDLNVLMESLAKYKNMDRFASLYKNLETEENENGINIINLESCVDKKIESKTIFVNPSQKAEILILGNDEEFDQLRKRYDENTLSLFRDLMFFIQMDLEYGINNWTLVAEDEYIEDPIYPGIVTGEFIGQEKNKNTMNKVRKKQLKDLEIYINNY